ncbi:MAG: serine/threonine protein kinase [Verrucomicrobiae bacterium]|nr:serine/threonine protein kinase [Verrucomicrobiae bacterium]
MDLTRCGQYLLHDRLNEGGNAEIFLATGDSNRTVVIRRLLPRFRFRFAQRKMFLHGLRIHARMDHENIVRVFAVENDWFIPYGVLEYVDGDNLRILLNKQAPLIREPIPIFRQMLLGLQHVHRQGYLHLDFKPENVLIARDRVTKLVDFDLSIRIPRKPAPLRELSGTPSYLSPEQILREPVDERSDIFSLGVTAFELFVGQKPFTPLERRDIMSAYTARDVAFPSPKAIKPALPQKLSRILSNCIEKRADRRYPTISLILRDLEAVAP